MHFQARAGEKLADTRLQRNLKKLADKFVTARSSVIQEIDFTATRQAAVERRNRALDRLDVWLEMFERNAQARGATVLFAETPAQASELVVKIAQQHDVKLVTKSKSMVSEEMALNAALSVRALSPSRPIWVSTFCRSMTTRRPAISLRLLFTKTKKRFLICFPRFMSAPASPIFLR